MGFPLAPVFSNLFMGHHEKTRLENYKVSRILFHHVDVTQMTRFVYLTQNMMLFSFLIITTPLAPEGERDPDHNTPFLDVLVDNNSSQFLITSIYRKKTFTGLLTNYFSFPRYRINSALLGPWSTEPIRSTIHRWVFIRASKN